MAFPVGWNRRCPLVIQHSQVVADQTQFPVCLTNATNCLPAEMVTSGGGNAAQSDGGDIRFSTDINGTSQIACEIVQFTQNATPANASVEIWVPVNILTASDVTIYVWYNAGGGQAQPAANAPFGSQAVWDSNYTIVEHFGDGTTLSVNDSTSNGNNGTNHSGTATSGKFGGGINFSASNNYVAFSAGVPSGANARSFEMWINTSDTNLKVMWDQGNTSASGNRWIIYTPNSSNNPFVDINGASINALGSGAVVRDGTWHHLTVRAVTNITNTHMTIDGVDASMGSANLAMNTVATPVNFNNDFGAGSFGHVGKYDEVRVSNVVRSANWYNSCYNTQSSPGTFTVAGTPTNTGGGGTLKANPLSGGGSSALPLVGYIL